MSQNHQPTPSMVPMSITGAFPAHIYNLLTSHNLGVPQVKYSGARRGWLCFIGCVLIILASTSYLFWSFSFSPSSDSLLLLIVLVSLVPLFFVIALLVAGIHALGERTYVCSEGYIALHYGQVRQVLRWDQVEAAWKETVLVQPGQLLTSRMGGYVPRQAATVYYIKKQGETIEFKDIVVWRRINYEVQHRAFLQQYPAMLARFQADRPGRPLPFGNLTLTHAGLTIPGGVLFNRQGWQLPLSAIQQVRLEERRLVVVAYPGSGFPTVRIPHPPGSDDTANLLFFLAALSQGRIACTSIGWQ